MISSALTTPINCAFALISAPTVEPITVDELKTFARIDGTDEDTLLEDFIKAARQQVEEYLRRALITQTWSVVIDEWPSGVLELQKPPLQSVSSIVTVDEDGTETTYSSDNYYVVTEAIPGYVALKFSVTPPQNTSRYHAGYKVTYVAGYGATGASLPSAIKNAIFLWATAIYENRAITTDPPPQAKPLLDLYRVVRL